MKLTLAETKLLKDSLAIVAELVTEVRFDVGKDGLTLIAMDPANVAMVVYNLLSSSFVEYEAGEGESIAINLNEFKQVLRRIKPADTLTLEVVENKLKITLKSTSKREFSLPLIDLEEKEQRVPELSFNATIETTSETLTDAIEDVDVVGESVSFAADANNFYVSSSSDLTNADIEVPADDNTKITVTEEAKSKYSIEYLKKMTPAAKIADKVKIQFSKDYPLQLEYVLLDKMSLKFILAPRVDND